MSTKFSDTTLVGIHLRTEYVPPKINLGNLAIRTSTNSEKVFRSRAKEIAHIKSRWDTVSFLFRGKPVDGFISPDYPEYVIHTKGLATFITDITKPQQLFNKALLSIQLSRMIK